MKTIKAIRIEDESIKAVPLKEDKVIGGLVYLYKIAKNDGGKPTAIAKIAEVANICVGGETQLLINALKKILTNE